VVRDLRTDRPVRQGRRGFRRLALGDSRRDRSKTERPVRAPLPRPAPSDVYFRLPGRFLSRLI
jgi:hypothetical protein